MQTRNALGYGPDEDIAKGLMQEAKELALAKKHKAAGKEVPRGGKSAGPTRAWKKMLCSSPARTSSRQTSTLTPTRLTRNC